MGFSMVIMGFNSNNVFLGQLWVFIHNYGFSLTPMGC